MIFMLKMYKIINIYSTKNGYKQFLLVFRSNQLIIIHTNDNRVVVCRFVITDLIYSNVVCQFVNNKRYCIYNWYK